MRTALLVADVLAGFGLVLLVLGGTRTITPDGVLIGLTFSAIGLVLGVTLRFLIGRTDRHD